MESKTLTSMLGIFLLTFLTIGLASAVSLNSITNPVIPTSVEDDAGSFVITFDLTNTGTTGTLNWSDSVITSGTATISFDKNSITNDTTETITATVSFPTSQTGNIAGTIDVIGEGASTHRTLPFSVSLTTSNDFCTEGNADSELEISNFDINVVEGLGDDEEYWFPLDEVEIEFEVENKGDWDLNDIEIELCLYDNDENECVMDEGDMDIDDDQFDLDEGDDEETILVTFKVDPNDLNEGSTDYSFIVIANGEIKDSNAGSLNGDKFCLSESEDIEIKSEEFVIVDNIEVLDLTDLKDEGQISCGSEVQITADVWNIDESEIDGDDLYIQIFNNELGIREIINMDDLGSLDSERISVIVTIPEDADEKTYSLKISVFDDEDMGSSDIYENSEDDEAEYSKTIKVVDCGASTSDEPTISAILTSDAVVGEELVIQVSVTNNADATSIIVTAEGQELWADLLSVEPSILNLAEGQTQQIIMTLKPSISGTQSFSIKAIYNGKTVTQPVSVTISEEAGFLTGAFVGLGDTGMYIIAAVFLVLIILIIVLIVKVAGSGAAASEF